MDRTDKLEYQFNKMKKNKNRFAFFFFFFFLLIRNKNSLNKNLKYFIEGWETLHRYTNYNQNNRSTWYYRYTPKLYKGNAVVLSLRNNTSTKRQNLCSKICTSNPLITHQIPIELNNSGRSSLKSWSSLESWSSLTPIRGIRSILILILSLNFSAYPKKSFHFFPIIPSRSMWGMQLFK